MELLQHAQFDSVTFTSSGTNQAFACLVQSVRELECLDVAGATTLRDLLNSTTFNSSFVDTPEGALRANVLNQNDLMVNMMNPSVLDLSSTTLYGMGSTCDGKRVGDGVINGMDMYVYGASLFRLGPYANNPTDMSLIQTVQGREDTQSRCDDDPYERVDWQKRLSYASCFAVRDETSYQAFLSGRRLLQATHYEELGTSTDDMQPMRDLDARVFQWASGGDLGDWFLIQLPEINMAIDLFVRGAEPAPATQLSNVMAPAFNTTHVPESPSQFNMRFIRHRELAKQPTDDCAVIQASGDALSALQSGWISLSQRLPGEGSQRGSLCGFDIVLWQPSWAKQGRPCALQLSAGSTAMDGRLGAIQRFDSCSEPLGALYLVAPPPPTTTPSLLQLSPPPSAPPGNKRFVLSESHVSAIVATKEELYSRVESMRDVAMQSYMELLDETILFEYNITRILDEPSAVSLFATSYYTSRRLQESTLPCTDGTKVRLRIEITYSGDIDLGRFLELLETLSTQRVSIVCEASVDFADDPISPPPSPPPFPPNPSETDDNESVLMIAAILLGAASCCCCGAVAVVMRRKKKDEPKDEEHNLLVGSGKSSVGSGKSSVGSGKTSGMVRSACRPLLQATY